MISEKERLDTLLRALLLENPEYSCIAIPPSLHEKRMLLRSLMNVRPPRALSPEMLEIQDEELAVQRKEKGVVNMESIPVSPEYPRRCGDAVDICHRASETSGLFLTTIIGRL